MNPTERLNIWEDIADATRERLANPHPHGDADVNARIRADDQHRLKVAEGFVTMYDAKVMQMTRDEG